MVKKIFCKENFCNDKKAKNRLKARVSERVKNQSDKRAHSKYEIKLKKNTVRL